MPAFLELAGISKRFGGVRALDGVDLTVEAGEIHCLAGENGSGKSTLIKIVSGVQAPEPGGRIAIGGEALGRLTSAESIRRGVQVIYQDLSLFTNLTVAENIAAGLHRGVHLVDRGLIRRTAAAAIARIGVALDADAFVADLPIAQRQLVAICRAMAAQARLVIMDEPTASLTRREVDSAAGVGAGAQAERGGGDVCQPPARRGAGDRRAGHGASQRRKGGDIRGGRDDR